MALGCGDWRTGGRAGRRLQRRRRRRAPHHLYFICSSARLAASHAAVRTAHIASTPGQSRTRKAPILSRLARDENSFAAHPLDQGVTSLRPKFIHHCVQRVPFPSSSIAAAVPAKQSSGSINLQNNRRRRRGQFFCSVIFLLCAKAFVLRAPTQKFFSRRRSGYIFWEFERISGQVMARGMRHSFYTHTHSHRVLAAEGDAWLHLSPPPPTLLIYFARA